MLLASVRKRIEGSKSLHSHSYTSEYTLSLMSDSKRKQTSVRVCVCVCVQLTASIAAKWKKNEANLWAAPQASTGSTGYAYSIRCEWSECECVRGDSLSMCIIALYCVVCVFIYLCRRRRFVGLCLMIIVDFWRFDCQLYAWAKLRRNTGCGAWHCGST